MITEKPKINDKAILAATARILAPKVVKWLDNGLVETDRQLIADIVAAIYAESKGCAIALNFLDSYHADIELIKIFNDTATIKQDELSKALALWATENNLVSPEVNADSPVSGIPELNLFDVAVDEQQAILA